MTLGLYRADEQTDVLNVAHSRLWSTLETEKNYCGPRTYGTDCIIHMNDFRFAALRARTPTSASMVGVNKQPVEHMQEWDDQRAQAWWFAKKHFGTKRIGCKRTLDFLETNMAKILEDAEVGQCTEGHSCRVRTENAVAGVIIWMVAQTIWVAFTEKGGADDSNTFGRQPNMRFRRRQMS